MSFNFLKLFESKRRRNRNRLYQKSIQLNVKLINKTIIAYNKCKYKYLNKIKLISRCLIKRLSTSSFNINGTQIVGNLNKMIDSTKVLGNQSIIASKSVNLFRLSEPMNIKQSSPVFMKLDIEKNKISHIIHYIISPIKYVYWINKNVKNDKIMNILSRNDVKAYSKLNKRYNCGILNDFNDTKKAINKHINSLNKALSQELFSDKIKILKNKIKLWTSLLHNLNPNSVYVLTWHLDSPENVKLISSRIIIREIEDFDKRLNQSINKIHKIMVMYE